MVYSTIRRSIFRTVKFMSLRWAGRVDSIAYRTLVGETDWKMTTRKTEKEIVW